MIFLAAILLPLGYWASHRNGKYRETYIADHGDCASYLLTLKECGHGHCGDLNIFGYWLMDSSLRTT